ncbi:hypothetical protein [Lake Baikal phage Baikal-20-5m-C28]|nr:hypothetical protein [Lake Baikal phage Baikal-20-5m-C28]
MAIINVSLQDTFAQWRIATNAIGDYIGSTATLTTTSQNLTGAINELRANSISDGILNTGGWPFKVQVDNPDTYEFELDADGNLRISGTLTGNVTGNVTGNLTGNVTGNVIGNVTGAVTGNSSTATTLQTGRTIAITGDASWTSPIFNGSTNVTAALTLANSGVVAGTWSKVTVDAKGRITTGEDLAVSDVTTALGYTPWHVGNDGAASGLDADLLDGYNSSLITAASTIPVRDTNGDITTRIFIGRATSAQYADLAEKYTTDQEYEPGTVVVVASSADGGCNLPESIASYAIGQRVLGVISENPAYLMNSESTGQAIALRGRVPVKVVGSIRKGQPLICNEDGKGIYGDTNNSFAIALETNEEPSVKLVECVIV